MSDINADVTENTITVSVSGETISATVSGGQGPQGPAGASGVSSWNDIADKPSTFTPSAHTHAWSEIVSGTPTTLSGYGITDGVTTSDSRLTDSREWSAATVTQADAEAGTATDRKAWTVARVWQAIAAWWAASAAKTKLDGIASGATANSTDAQLRDRTTHTGSQAISTVTGLQTALDGKADSAHAASHDINGADPITITGDQVVAGQTWANINPTSDLLSDILYAVDVAYNERAYASHSHGQILDTGAIGSTANLPLITTTSGVITVGSFGSSANTFCAGNDSRLSDARTPTSHTHGNISNAGAIGSTANTIVVTTTSGVLTTATIGSGLTLSGGTLTSSGGSGSSVGSDLYLWSTYR